MISINKLIVSIILILSTFTILPTVTFARSTDKIPVIIDTDVSADDLLAMMYILRNKDFDVQGIIVVGTGETHCQAGIKNVGKLLRLVHRKRIPVACGKEHTVGNGHSFPDFIRQDADNMMGIKLPDNDKPNVYSDALALYRTLLGKSKQKVSILTIGPLTNIAELIQKEPVLISRINKIVVMGGALDVPGNVIEGKDNKESIHAEWNFYVDPEAVNITLKSHVPMILVPLDITNHIPLDKSFLAMFKKQHLNKTGLFAKILVEKLLSNLQYESETWYFWDPLAAIILANSSEVTFKQERIKILLSPVDKVATLERHPHGRLVLVASQIDTNFVKSNYIKIISEDR